MEKYIQGESVKKEKKFSGIFWLKGLFILLIIMLIFTILSRIAASFTVPKVSVEQSYSGKIAHAVTATGTIEAGGETAVVTEAGLLIAQVNVHAGAHVDAGELLFTLDTESIGEQISELNSQIKKLELENESAEENKEQTAAKQQLDLKRAQEDYADTVSKNEAAEEKAQKELKSAADAKLAAEKELNDAKDNVSQKEKERNDAKAAQDNASASLQSEKDALQAAVDAGEDTEALEKNVQKLQAAYDAAVALAEEKQTAYDTAVENFNEKKSASENCDTQLKEKQEAAETDAQAQKEALKTAARAIEDANISADTDNSEQINAITIAQYEKQLESLTQLKENNGEVRALAGGIITKVYAETGQKTTDTAAVVMSDEKSGLLYTAIVDSSNLKYLSVSDEADISGTGKKEEGCTISSIETLEGGKSVKVTVSLTGDDFSLGESAAMTVTRKSEQFDYIIPVTAIYEENNKAYIYLLDTENSILGEQYIARKAEVEILDKNTSYAAVSSSLLNADSQVITESDRNVGAGDIVRLAE